MCLYNFFVTYLDFIEIHPSQRKEHLAMKKSKCLCSRRSARWIKNSDGDLKWREKNRRNSNRIYFLWILKSKDITVSISSCNNSNSIILLDYMRKISKTIKPANRRLLDQYQHLKRDNLELHRLRILKSFLKYNKIFL